MRSEKLFGSLLIAIIAVFFFNSCQSIKNINDALLNLKRVQFKLENVQNFTLSGVRLDNKTSLSNISGMDVINLTRAYANKSLPAEFTLNIAARNPNDGTGGARQSNATLTRLDWQLYIDDVPTISGLMDQDIVIPGTGQTTFIPLRLNLDLYQFFQNKSYESIVNLALAVGGVSGSPARLKLDVKPTISTQFGPITYPGRITIIDKEFRS